VPFPAQQDGLRLAQADILRRAAAEGLLQPLPGRAARPGAPARGAMCPGSVS
jgi:hypothetical protein